MCFDAKLSKNFLQKMKDQKYFKLINPRQVIKIYTEINTKE